MKRRLRRIALRQRSALPFEANLLFAFTLNVRRKVEREGLPCGVIGQREINVVVDASGLSLLQIGDSDLSISNGQLLQSEFPSRAARRARGAAGGRTWSAARRRRQRREVPYAFFVLH